MPDYIGAIDQGTTSTRFIIFDRRGSVVALAQKEHRQIFLKPGWVEHNPEEIWRCTQEVIAEAMRQSQLRTKDLAALGIANQRETIILWNRKTGQPVYNAIVWQDMRVEDAVATFSLDGGQDRFRRTTGLPLATYFSGLKIRWILENVPGVRKLAESGEVIFGNVDSYIVWKLTGGTNGGIHVTDVTNASRTQLLNLKALSWDQEMLRVFGIPEIILPEIRPSSEVYGEAQIEPVKGVPIAGVLGDQQAALFGQACFKPGEAKNTYGTGSFLLMNTGSELVQSSHGLITTAAYKIGKSPSVYALEGSVAVTGALVQWLRDNLGLIRSSSEIEALARSVEDNGNVYFVPAFSGLFAPYWKASARGVIVGLTSYANKGHIARAVLEAAAFQTRDVLEAMERDSKTRIDVLRVDGGMVANGLLMQFQADVLNRPVVCPAVTETTALGAAYAAGLATGFFKDLNEIRASQTADRTWMPRMPEEIRERCYRRWKKAVTRSFDWLDEPRSGS
ncbi:MAG: glycerol kinase GlpK [Candidatus Acidiferrales bacterium]